MTDDTSAGGAVLEQVIELIRNELTAVCGENGFHQWSDNAFLRVEGGAVLLIVATPVEEDAVVNVRCYLVRDVERPDPDLGDFLARLNAERLFGAFSIDEDGDVCYDYSILGSSLTPAALHLAIQAVAEASAAHAPEIIARWGGISSIDKLRQEIDELPADDEDEGSPN